MKQFYIDLSNWVETINQKAQQLPEQEYWDYIWKSSDELVKKYNENKLVAAVVKEHVYFLVEIADGDKYPF